MGLSLGISAGVGSGGTASARVPGTWEPTVLYLLVLIVAEMFVFGFLGHLLK